MQPFIDSLTALFQLLAAHKRGAIIAVLLVVAYWVFNAAVDAMPEPTKDSTDRYRFWWKFFNKLSGNFSKVAKVLHVPGADQP